MYAQSVSPDSLQWRGYILIEECSSQKTKALGSKSGSKRYKYSSAADELQWMVTLSADFTFNGTTSSCTYVREPKSWGLCWEVVCSFKICIQKLNVATGKVEMKRAAYLFQNLFRLQLHFLWQKRKSNINYRLLVDIVIDNKPPRKLWIN